LARSVAKYSVKQPVHHAQTDCPTGTRGQAQVSRGGGRGPPAVHRAARLAREQSLSGALTGLGCVWTVLAAKTMVDCAPTGDWCGQTPLVPFTALAIATLTLGVIATAMSVRRSRTPSGQ
jgi:hypothetical protein